MGGECGVYFCFWFVICRESIPLLSLQYTRKLTAFLGAHKHTTGALYAMKIIWSGLVLGAKGNRLLAIWAGASPSFRFNRHVLYSNDDMGQFFDLWDETLCVAM
jgi:hypothetical protein